MLKQWQKLISTIMVISILFGLVSMPTGFAATFQTNNGVLDIEAEKTSYVKTNLSIVKNKLFSGGEGLSVGIEDKVVPALDAVPDIDLTFKADKEGSYKIWLRSTGKQTNDSGNSIFLSLEGGEYKYTRIGGEPEAPMWMAIGTVKASAGVIIAVKLRIRQKNEMVFDRFIITADPTYTPTDAALGLNSGKSAATAAPSITPAPGTSFAPAASTAPQYTTKDGTLTVEAEDAKYNKANFETASGSDMSGGKGLAVVAEDKTVPPPNAAGDIDLSFTADKAGTYAVWVRNKSNNSSGGNSIFVAVDHGEYKYTILTGTPEEFAWTKIGSVTVVAGGVGSVRVSRRQRYNIVLDKFVITSNKLYTPAGMGGDPSSMDGIKLPENVYPKPTVTPPSEHPRVMFTKKDIPAIKAGFEAEQNKAAYAAWQQALAVQTDGKLPDPAKAGATNYNVNFLTAIEAAAFDYAINGNEESGKKAVLAMRNYAYTIVFDSSELSYRYKGHVIFAIGQVYDWCYPLLNDTDKKEMIALAESIANGLAMGYPPKGQGAVSGHGGENNLLRDLLALGIATYDERPDIYNFCAGRILAEHVPARNEMYKTHAHLQGNAYGNYRGGFEIWSAWLFKRMSGQDVFSAEQQYFPYQWLYSRRPDGQTFRIGDDYNQAGGRGAYWSGWVNTLFLVSNYYNDDFLKREFARECANLSVFSTTFSIFTPVTFLTFNNPALEGKSAIGLPLSKYFPSPKGMMIARTGWNDGKTASDVVALMNVGERYPANHAHLDSGHFQLYYKGILASDSGAYSDGYGTDHDINYHKRGVARNILTIYNPNESLTRVGKPLANDGGLRYPADGAEAPTLEAWLKPDYETGKVLGQEFGPDPITPQYTYIKGDITKAYSDKAKEVLRSMVFLPLEDADHPAAMIVMDKVESSDAAFKKSWLLHVQEEPKVEGNRTIVTRTEKGYNGRMVVETLLPQNAAIATIGGEGKQSWVDGKNYPPKTPDNPTGDSEATGWGRVEISPSSTSKVNYFLNVMTVSDADTKATDLQSTLIEGDQFVGAVISNRVAIFGKDTKRMEDSLKFTIPGSGSFQVFVSGIKEGTWTTADGQQVVVSKDGGAAYFTANAGEVALTYQSGSSSKPKPETVANEADRIGIRINKAFIHSDVAPVVKEGRTLIPMRVIFENLDAQVAWDEQTRTATAVKDGVQIKITEDSKTAIVAGQAKELDVPAAILDGRFVVPVRFVAEAMGAKVTWDPFANLVDIVPGKMPSVGSVAGKPKEGAATIKSSEWSGDEQDIGYFSYDGDATTRWSVDGAGAWIIYTLDQEYTIQSVYINFYQGEKRAASFDLYYSLDGKEYKPMLEKAESNGKEDGQTYALPAPVTCKYVKFVGKGNSVNTWNSIQEIEFKTK